MILSDRDIKKYLKSKKIRISPQPNFKIQLGSASLDLRLGNEFRVFDRTKKSFIDLEDPKTYKDLSVATRLSDRKSFIIHPGEFVLAVTKEKIELPSDIGARIDGRSSLGRLGIVVHSTAGHVDPGFRGHLTLEMSNIGLLPIILRPGMRICQLVFEKLSSPTLKPYHQKKKAKYIGQNCPQGYLPD